MKPHIYLETFYKRCGGASYWACRSHPLNPNRSDLDIHVGKGKTPTMAFANGILKIKS